MNWRAVVITVGILWVSLPAFGGGFGELPQGLAPSKGASAANVSGYWRLTFTGAKKLKGDTTLSLTQQAANLSGTLHTAGGELQVRGEIIGNHLTVSGRKIMRYTLNATLNGGQLEGTLQIATLELPWIAQRMAAKAE